MKIIILTGMGEPEYSTNKSMIAALKSIGHEVKSCGPPYWDRGYDADIPLQDKPFPERYTYEEILSKAPWTPELLLVIEPHAWLTGYKPQGIISAAWTTDLHRGGVTFRDLLKEGNFDILFNAQPHFHQVLESCAPVVEALPPAFDRRRYIGAEQQPLCDITFVGQTGIAGLLFTKQDMVGQYTDSPPPYTDERRFAFPVTFDYARRAEMLMRLMRDFQVRIYDRLDGPSYVAGLQAGSIGINCSLLNDISMRNFEVMAARRALVTDAATGAGQLYQDTVHCLLYRGYGYNPLLTNFVLDYDVVKEKVQSLLNDGVKRRRIAEAGYQRVWAQHSFEHRAIQLTGIFEAHVRGLQVSVI